MTTPTPSSKRGLTPDEWIEFFEDLQQLDRWQLFTMVLLVRWLTFKQQCRKTRDWLNGLYTRVVGKALALALVAVLAWLVWMAIA